MQCSKWKQSLKELTESLVSNEVSAGEVYSLLDLPTEQARRRTVDSVAVRALMRELGWAYHKRRFHPRFVRIAKEESPVVAIVDKQADQPPEPVKSLEGLNDRHLRALSIVENDWKNCDNLGISADFLAARLKLQGKDTARTARNILEVLASRNLLVKTLRSTQSGVVARYAPTNSTIEQIGNIPATAPKDAVLLLLSRYKDQSVRETELCQTIQKELHVSEQHAKEALRSVVAEFGHCFTVLHRSHDRPPAYAIWPSIDRVCREQEAVVQTSGRYIYFIQWDNDPAFVKIGYSTAPISRFSAFLTSSAHRLKILGLIEVAAQEEEFFLHTFFQT
jgi:hypothetical protein